MHASQLAEISSWVAVHSANLVYGSQEQPMLVATQYWSASKIRLERWVTALHMFEQDLADSASRADAGADAHEDEAIRDFDELDFGNLSNLHDPWPALEIVIQEVFYSEMLTRIWSATVLTHDWYHRRDELHGLAHSVHISHLEARNRALRILVKGQAENEVVCERLNGLRRRLERWTDLFLGQLPRSEQASKFGFDRNRVLDFNSEQRRSLGPEFVNRQKILMASFATDLMKDRVPYSANPELNGQIASGILACFPADRFDSNGLPKSAQMIWMEKSQNDTQMLMDQLLNFDSVAIYNQ